MNVLIIYNPNSTGDGEANAKNLARTLRDGGLEVTLRKTTHAGHGEEIAESYSKKDENIVLISSSGDGGYHEVVNGALKYKTKNLVVGVLPSGNANDHFSALGSDSLAQSILRKDYHNIDTIKVTATIDGAPWTQFAHSYVGMGVTATAAKSLTEDRPNVFTEKWIVARALLSFRYVKIKENGKVRHYSSILFGNIDKMSKVLKLSEDSSVTDGKFEKTSIRFRSKFRLVVYLLTAATVGLKRAESLASYECVAVGPVPMQLDGEVYTIDAGSKITVESIKRNLRCVL